MRPHLAKIMKPRLSTGRSRASTSLMAGLLIALGATGCEHKEESHYQSPSKPPTVEVVHPEIRTIIRDVGQPSFIEAFERTAIYPKLTGYIEKWVVDIGDKVNKGDLLATLFVPELVEDFGTKKATVQLDQEKVAMAKVMVSVAEADTKAAEARLQESQAILAKFQAEVDRWDTEVKRLTREVSRGVVDNQILLESTNQLKSSLAAKDAASATIRTSDADLLSYQAKLSKAKVDVAVANADLAVATSEMKRIEAWTGYLTLSAPFKGIIVARNANTFDFVKPGEGDPNADRMAPYEGPGKTAAPIYVVDRTDIVRVFIDIPESDANYVQIGAPASVLARAYRDEPISGTVTRTSWALNVKSRTLRAEIDLPNTDSQLLPGMYAYATVVIERRGVRTIPVSATTHTGDETYCWMYADGKAKRTEVRTGVSDGDYIEIVSLGGPMPTTGMGGASSKNKMIRSWNPVQGSEQIILGDLSVLSEGGKVEVSSKPPAEKPQVAQTP